MAFVHGKSTFCKVASTDLSAFCTSVETKQKADSHDTTTFGQTGHTYIGGLTDGTITVKGNYDSGATAPHDIVQPLLGTVTTFEVRPEGTGTGKPAHTGSCLVTSYEESMPVADLVTFSFELQISGAVSVVNQ